MVAPGGPGEAWGCRAGDGFSDRVFRAAWWHAETERESMSRLGLIGATLLCSCSTVELHRRFDDPRELNVKCSEVGDCYKAIAQACPETYEIRDEQWSTCNRGAERRFSQSMMAANAQMLGKSDLAQEHQRQANGIPDDLYQCEPVFIQAHCVSF